MTWHNNWHRVGAKCLAGIACLARMSGRCRQLAVGDRFAEFQLSRGVIDVQPEGLDAFKVDLDRRKIVSPAA